MTGELPVNSQPEKDLPGCKKLEAWLNTTMKIKMTDGRVLIGVFVCTDKDRNVILGSCNEYLGEPDDDKEEPKTIGLAMVPGHHIVSIEMDCDQIKTVDDVV